MSVPESKVNILHAVGLTEKRNIKNGTKSFNLPNMDKYYGPRRTNPVRKSKKQKKVQVKQIAEPNDRQKLLRFLSNNPRLPLTSLLGNRLIKWLDASNQVEQSNFLIRNEFFCKTVYSSIATLSDSDSDDDAENAKIITKNKHIFEGRYCHKYALSKHQKRNRTCEMALGLDTSSFPLLNKCRPLSVPVQRPTNVQMRGLLIASGKRRKRIKRSQNLGRSTINNCKEEQSKRVSHPVKKNGINGLTLDYSLSSISPTVILTDVGKTIDLYSFSPKVKLTRTLKYFGFETITPRVQLTDIGSLKPKKKNAAKNLDLKSSENIISPKVKLSDIFATRGGIGEANFRVGR